MIRMEQAEKLLECYATLNGIADELDAERSPCDCCGRDAWENLTEGRVAQEVAVMMRKARKCISLIQDELVHMENMK